MSGECDKCSNHTLECRCQLMQSGLIIDCVSDLHGHYPELEGGDLLIVAGDLTAGDTIPEYHAFSDWANAQAYELVVVIAGNHDNILQKEKWQWLIKPDKIHYLCDSATEFCGMKIWGSPWTTEFIGMNPHCDAFTVNYGVDSDDWLNEYWGLIPTDTDILITHGPPYGILDENIYGIHCGSKSLRDKVEIIKPKLHVFGHIHEQGGLTYRYQCPYEDRDTTFVNASLMNERYQPVNKPVRVIW